MNELELILTDTFHCSRANLYLNSPSILLKDKDWKRLDKIFKDRGRQVPVQYILGYTEFMGLRLKVRKGVLIPRPDTEILVEAAIEKLQEPKNRKKKPKILDIGTGSGCIAISLAKFSQDTDILAIDISAQAIKLAAENAKLHNVESRISFLETDIFSVIKDRMSNVDNISDRKFDVIVCNPPYVSTSEIGVFDRDTLSEPRLALDGGSDGFDFYRSINKGIGKLLKKDGFLIMEIGYNQAEGIKNIFSYGWAIEEIRKDYQGIERVCIMKRITNG
ncbi:MAG: peptide chain release factor N(5)-glutamine methyltransferase [Candidatus Omnitrophica bacterium]|nr:peptide chain release factor N(5)-glutamine methyltransferase [Candidatus Omnitrophota bacterium]MDD5355980.1 peptide chain release factor N(5)-glutamine methyltransferase [Candidatus Omnitrophota bacterium]